VFLFFSDLELKPVGILEVKLVQAKELTNKDIIGKSDPYAELYVRPLRDRMKTSKTIVSSAAFPLFLFYSLGFERDPHIFSSEQ
jgi:Ca2+-dependent lipid-binding protein